ncbi:TPA: hypothetical protein RZC51_002660 [Burkholderia cenocepacia]|nr:hypothetical protein [Burkholderia cenocepacia]
MLALVQEFTQALREQSAAGAAIAAGSRESSKALGDTAEAARFLDRLVLEMKQDMARNRAA